MSSSAIDLQLNLPRRQFVLDVDINLPLVGITGFFGPSGCGKTSILRCIAGLENAQGRIDIGGDVWLDSDAGVRIAPHLRSVAYVFQDVRLFPHMSAYGNLVFGLSRTQRRMNRELVDDTIRLLGLENLLEHRPNQLSGGEAQRVAMGRSILRQPRLLLMDEPFAALDMSRKAELMPYLQRIHHQLSIPVIYVSHSMDEMFQLADAMVLMEKGEVRAHGSLTDLLTRADAPLAACSEGCTILKVYEATFDEHHHATELQSEIGALWLPGDHSSAPTRLRVSASDVSISLVEQEKTSILNSFNAEITMISAASEAYALVELSICDTPVLAHISKKSLNELKLACGMKVYANIKSAAIHASSI